MGRKRPERTEQRAQMRDARQRVRDREKLAGLSPGGAREWPLTVTTAAVIEPRAAAIPCAQCQGAYRVKDHRSVGPGERAVDVRCEQCGVPRTLWFRIVDDEPN